MEGQSFNLKYYKKKKNKCSLCEQYVETTIHIFCECKISVNFYNQSIKYLFGPMSSIKVLYNPDISNHDVKKYTIWQVRNLVKVGKSLH